MKRKINTLITSLYLGSIDKEKFLKEYFNGKPHTEEYVLEMIKKGVESKDEVLIEESIVLICTGAFSLSSFTLELCQLLLMPWHNKHEDIIMLLEKIADTSTVECIYKATELQFDYLDYDDTFQFARKCIKALSAIGNTNAIDKLKLLLNSKTHKISEYAKKELGYMRLL